MPEAFDIVVIGGGPGGYVAALHGVHLGARVALVEAGRVGGTCLNRGCIPTKAMVQDAELYDRLRSGGFGISAPGGYAVDFPRLLERRDTVVETLVSGVERLLDAQGVRAIRGRGRIVKPGLVRVQREDGASEDLSARAIIVATGSVPDPAPIPGADLPGVVDSDGLLALETLPERMVVIGASTIGIEFACLYATLGTRVAVLEKYVFLKDADPQLARRFRAMLRRRGVVIATDADVREIRRTDGGALQVAYAVGGEEAMAEGEVVLMATGRRPYVDGLGLEALGVAMKGGAVAVNARMETSVPGIYAIGDCIGGYLLAHVASYEGEVAVDNVMGRRRAADYAVVPNCIYTIPEIAGVGLTEQQAREAGYDVRVSRFPFRASGRALTLGEADGQIRMVCERGPDGRGGRVLGVHILGPRAGDAIAEAAMALRTGATAEDIAHTIHQHPTIPEALMEAAMAQLDGAIHYEGRAEGRGMNDEGWGGGAEGGEESGREGG